MKTTESTGSSSLDDAVLWAYRLFFGREPERPELIDQHLTLNHSVEEVRRAFMSSEEFQSTFLNTVPEKAAVFLSECQSTTFVKSCVDAQIGPWKNKAISFDEMRVHADASNRTVSSIYVCEIENGSAHLWEKQTEEDHLNFAYKARALSFLELIKLSIDGIYFDKSIIMILDVGDEAPDSLYLPKFSFQKRRGDLNILLPDFEFILYNFSFPSDAQAIPFMEKVDQGIFSGSTTGLGPITMQDAIDSTTQRLRAHKFFRHNPLVDFRLPFIVQCENSDVERYLRDMGLGEEAVSWSQAFKHKFIISIDGNGATCSRPLFILNSSSVLLKYDSPYILFWTDMLIPWLHFIPIKTDQDVIDVILKEKASPGSFSYITTSGSIFASQHLSKSKIIHYTSTLILNYSSLFLN